MLPFDHWHQLGSWGTKKVKDENSRQQQQEEQEGLLLSPQQSLFGKDWIQYLQIVRLKMAIVLIARVMMVVSVQAVAVAKPLQQAQIILNESTRTTTLLPSVTWHAWLHQDLKTSHLLSPCQPGDLRRLWFWHYLRLLWYMVMLILKLTPFGASDLTAWIRFSPFAPSW